MLPGQPQSEPVSTEPPSRAGWVGVRAARTGERSNLVGAVSNSPAACSPCVRRESSLRSVADLRPESRESFPLRAVGISSRRRCKPVCVLTKGRESFPAMPEPCSLVVFVSESFNLPAIGKGRGLSITSRNGDNSNGEHPQGNESCD